MPRRCSAGTRSSSTAMPMSSWPERAAGVAVVGEQVLEVEATDQRVALDAAVGDVAALDARALAVTQLADAAARERALVEDAAMSASSTDSSGRKPLPSLVCSGSTITPTIGADLRAAAPAGVGHGGDAGARARARAPGRGGVGLRRAVGAALGERDHRCRGVVAAVLCRVERHLARFFTAPDGGFRSYARICARCEPKPPSALRVPSRYSSYARAVARDERSKSHRERRLTRTPGQPDGAQRGPTIRIPEAVRRRQIRTPARCSTTSSSAA